MQFIDTHIHLQDYKSKNAPLIAGQAAGVSRFVCAAVKEADWAKIAAWAEEKTKQVIPAFGLHPWYLSEAAAGWDLRLEAMLRAHSRALVGECGLDRLKDVAPEIQKQVFATHIELAETLYRPLLVHAVRAQDWLEEFWKSLQKVRFVLHSFSGSAELLKRALGFGAYVSLAPSARRHKNFAELAAIIPAERLLLESDGPYQGEPEDIPALAKEIAALRGVEAAGLAARIYQNSEEFINV